MLGDIRPEELGFTQCHEHLLIRMGKSYEINPALFMEDPGKSARELWEYRQAGGTAVVDAQPVGCSRDSENLVKIARKTGVHVIASTGFHKLQFYGKNHWIYTMSGQNLSEVFVNELLGGMYTDTDREWNPQQQEVKAGIVKTALDACNLTEDYRRLFAAAARAQKKTGAPMMVHIEAGSSPEILADFLLEQGVKPERVYFCHMDRACREKKTFFQILEAGISLEFDTIGRFKYHDDKEEIRLIKEILEQGYEEQLLFSLDTTRERLKAYTPGGVGLTYILKTFLPAMGEAGITGEQIEKISVKNPRRILSWQ